MAEYSFDVTCTIDKQELKNAIDSVHKEIANRFDFKNISFEIKIDKDTLHLQAENKMKIDQLIDIVKEKIIKRDLDVRAFTFGELKSNVSGNYHCVTQIQQGLNKEQCKKINELIKLLKTKAKTRTQGDALRVSSKSKNELQEIITNIKNQDLGFAISIENFR